MLILSFSDAFEATDVLPSTASVTPHIAFINEISRVIRKKVEKYNSLRPLGSAQTLIWRPFKDGC